MEEEYLIFTEEIRRLYQDYFKCHDELIRQLIYDDIVTLLAVINEINNQYDESEQV